MPSFVCEQERKVADSVVERAVGNPNIPEQGRRIGGYARARQKVDRTNLSIVQESQHEITRLGSHSIVRSILHFLPLRFGKATGTPAILVLGGIGAQTKRVREVDWITGRIPIQIQPPRQSNRVFLRKSTRWGKYERVLR
jgi:hypothetical protein